MQLGTVTTPGLNMHSEPGGGKIVHVLARGDRIEVLGRVQHAKLWLYVRDCDSRKGHVAAEHVKLDAVPPLAPPPPDLEPGWPRMPPVYHPPVRDEWVKLPIALWALGAAALAALLLIGALR